MSQNLPHRPLRVLVVEDETLLAEAIEAALQYRGHTVSVAHDALTAIQLEAHDVVLCDLRLPDASGYELVESLRRRGHDSAYVLVSGSHDPEQFQAALHVGALAFLNKPFRLDTVVEAVERADCSWRAWRTAQTERFSATGGPGTESSTVRRLSAWLLAAGASPALRLRAATSALEVLRAGDPSNEPTDFAVNARAVPGGWEVHVARGPLAEELDPAPPTGTELYGRGGGLMRARALAESATHESDGRRSMLRLEFHETEIAFEADPTAEFSDVDVFEPDSLLRLLLRARNGAALDLAPATSALVGRLLSTEQPALSALGN